MTVTDENGNVIDERGLTADEEEERERDADADERKSAPRPWTGYRSDA